MCNSRIWSVLNTHSLFFSMHTSMTPTCGWCWWLVIVDTLLNQGGASALGPVFTNLLVFQYMWISSIAKNGPQCYSAKSNFLLINYGCAHSKVHSQWMIKSGIGIRTQFSKDQWTLYAHPAGTMNKSESPHPGISSQNFRPNRLDEASTCLSWQHDTLQWPSSLALSVLMRSFCMT